MVKHSRHVVFQMAEVVVPKALYGEILDRITDEKSPVRVRRKNAKILDFRQISVSWRLSGRGRDHWGDRTC